MSVCMYVCIRTSKFKCIHQKCSHDQNILRNIKEGEVWINEFRILRIPDYRSFASSELLENTEQ